MHDADTGENRVRQNHPVAAHEPENSGVKLVGAAAVVRVHQNQLGALGLGAAQVVHPREADHVFLKALPVLRANLLLARPDGCPTFFAQPVNHGGRGNEGVAVGNLGVGLAREHAGGEGAELAVVDLLVAC